ncbi:hypothetical protein JOF53_007840 [Crossiella equi]|uniref:Condensation domain-containing protein n=1 Tax=Crossiella equi TaxID=130796 RepID=A0ABS5AQX6_9PSEU|nr:condensation domain-containing protein [Crossiella equi]MBP2478968.1 hypothetical protein [Crossiella equi]
MHARLFPLTTAQRGLRPDAVDHRLYVLTGPVRLPALRAALAELVRRHEPLRTTCAAGGQRVHEEMPVPVRVYPAADPLALARELVRQPFPAGEGPLLRVYLLRSAGAEHLLVVWHRLVMDSWGVGVWCRELSALYYELTVGEHTHLPPAPGRYADWAAWRDGLATSARTAELLAWWAHRLAATEPLALPAHGQPSGQARRSVRLLSTQDLERVEDTAHRAGTTVYAVLAAACADTLRRHTGQERFVLGTPVSHRDRGETSAMLGCFQDTLPIPLDLGGAHTLEELSPRLLTAATEAFSRRHLSYDQLRRVLPGGGLRAHFSHRPLDWWTAPSLPACEPVDLDLPDTDWPFALRVDELPGGARVVLDVDPAVHTAELAERFLADYVRALLDGGVPEQARRPVNEWAALRLATDYENWLEEQLAR